MRLIGLAIGVLSAIALVAAACGGTSSSDKTSTAVAGGVGGAAVTPVTTSGAAGTSTSGSPTAAAGSPTAAATAAKTGTASSTAAAGAPVNETLTTASGSTIAFDKTSLTVPAGAKVTVTYTNNSDLAHNVHFFNGTDASAPSLGMTQIATGPNTQTVSFTAPTTPGTYLFHCDAHPTQMIGQLVVQ